MVLLSVPKIYFFLCHSQFVVSGIKTTRTMITKYEIMMVKYKQICATMVTRLQLLVLAIIHLLLWLQEKTEAARLIDILTWLNKKTKDDYDKMIEALMETKQFHVANILRDPTSSASGGLTVSQLVANGSCNLVSGHNILLLFKPLFMPT